MQPVTMAETTEETACSVNGMCAGMGHDVTVTVQESLSRSCEEGELLDLTVAHRDVGGKG